MGDPSKFERPIPWPHSTTHRAFELIALAAEVDTLIGTLRDKLAEITAEDKEVHDNLVASGVAA